MPRGAGDGWKFGALRLVNGDRVGQRYFTQFTEVVDNLTLVELVRDPDFSELVTFTTWLMWPSKTSFS